MHKAKGWMPFFPMAEMSKLTSAATLYFSGVVTPSAWTQGEVNA